MAPKAGKSVGSGGFLNWKELTRGGEVARLAVFKIREFMPAEKGDFGPKLPVKVDVLICDGDELGEVHGSEVMFGAPSGPLRGVKNPKAGEPIPDAVNAVGDELIFRVTYVTNRKGSQAFIGLDEPSAAEVAAAEDAYGKYAWNGRPTSIAPAAAPAQSAPLAATGTDGPAAAAPAGEKMPWEK